ncbi:M48 family metallopeptidase [Psychrobacter pygoscelis]|uniref:M48 family metallopeptidase n=1 Tax=Psychrobacter pygoscelis TaxID=2488563 RepID=UPI00103F23EA|nr:SprT family zinc-dependent metalloprotease [Psychrobacter pygoscelis]
MEDTIRCPEIYYGDDIIAYEVVRKPAKGKCQSTNALPYKPAARKIRIKVHPDGRVVVTAPEEATEAAIHEAVRKRVRWIWQGLHGFAKQMNDVLPKCYISGETQFYLGRRYVLKVLTDPSQPSSVKLVRGKFNVNLSQEVANKELRAAQIKALIDDWYHIRARTIFAERIEAMLPKASWVTGMPDFKVMVMQKQWGSCSAKGKLVLNRHLIKAPKDCIDYVILHELCHIEVHNHSEQFWRLLTQVMPEWKAVKTKLDDMAEQYLNE